MSITEGLAQLAPKSFRPSPLIQDLSTPVSPVACNGELIIPFSYYLFLNRYCIDEKHKIENIKQSDNKGDLTHLPEPKKSRLLEAKKEQDEKIQKQLNEHTEILQQIESDLLQLNEQIKQMEQERIDLRLRMIDNRELFRILNHKDEFTNEHHALFNGYARGQRNLDLESWHEEKSPENAQTYNKMMAILEILKPKE